METTQVNFRLSAKQRDRISEFFMDLAKLIVASVVLPFFVPGVIGESVRVSTLIIAVFLSMLCFSLGVRLMRSSNVQMSQAYD